MKTILVSDMFGRHGDFYYMDLWKRFLISKGCSVIEVWVDDLIPDAYSPFFKDQLHKKITSESNVSLAKEKMSMIFKILQPDMVISFSYGGYVSFLSSVDFDFFLVCISSNRLRLVDDFFSRKNSLFVFGENDDFSPGFVRGRESVLFIQGAGHEVYKDPSVLGRVVLSRFFKKSPFFSSCSKV